MIKDTLPNKSGDPEKSQKIIIAVRKLSNYCAHSWRAFAEDVLQVVLFTVLWFKWSVKKYCAVKLLLAIWEICLHENIFDYNYYKLNCKFAFISFLYCFRNQKQESSVNQVGGLVTRNISAFCL